jgi:hypothetical protein
LVVVIEEGPDGALVLFTFRWVLQVDCEIDAVQISIQQERLVDIEGKATDDIPEFGTVLSVDVLDLG